MNKTVLSLTNKGTYVLCRSVDNRLYNLVVPADLTVEILYSYYKMSDDDFAKLCKFTNINK